jgi:hypothetical protein
MYETLLVNEISVARALSLRTAEVRRLAIRGLLPSVLLPNGARRFDPNAIRRFVDGLRHVEPAPA